jgi:FMN phosphatase YigB (HAD superfamily)
MIRLSERSMLRVVLLDLGDTVIRESVDDKQTLDEMNLVMAPGARGALIELASRFRLGLVTDTILSPETSVRAGLRKLGIESFFDTIVTSLDVGVEKPDAKIFSTALQQLEASPSEALMVGNDPRRDILGARAAGIRSVLVTSSNYFEPITGALADHQISSMRELPQLVLQLAERWNQETLAD